MTYKTSEIRAEVLVATMTSKACMPYSPVQLGSDLQMIIVLINEGLLGVAIF
jgi:hypothetical protein